MISSKGCERMGNVLESDSSADSEIGEVRTDGDGMEMERQSELGNLPAVVLHQHNIRQDSALALKIAHGVHPPGYNNDSQATGLSTVPFSPRKNRTSPKVLPPIKDLILLKPIRIGDSVGQAQLEVQQHDITLSNAQLTSSNPNRKQREPKFVPYEPYSAAVRPMGTISRDERRDSSASSSIIAVSDDLSLPSIQSPKKSQSPRHQPESSNTTLLKERLRISEKDIQELRTENARLKRLLVDTLSGSYEVPVADAQSAKANKMQESVESLSNEIQVWRSKFLSSCVLVEQLTKEKEDLVRATGGAAELFKEIKANVDLTPELYNSLREWISAEEKERTIRKESSFASLEDDDI